MLLVLSYFLSFSMYHVSFPLNSWCCASHLWSHLCYWRQYNYQYVYLCILSSSACIYMHSLRIVYCHLLRVTSPYIILSGKIVLANCMPYCYSILLWFLDTEPPCVIAIACVISIPTCTYSCHISCATACLRNLTHLPQRKQNRSENQLNDGEVIQFQAHALIKHFSSSVAEARLSFFLPPRV